jgi:hypothetical protein
MDIPLLAQALTIFLAPALPYLLTLGEKAAEEAAKKLGGDVWARAKELWGKLRPKVEEKPAVLETAHDVAATPAEPRAREMLQYQLEKVLKADPGLAAELERLLASAGALHVYQARLEGDGAIAQGPGAVAAGKGGVAAGGSVSGSTIVTGDRNRVRSGDEET